MEDFGLKDNQIKAIMSAANSQHLQVKVDNSDNIPSQEIRKTMIPLSTAKKLLNMNGIENNVKNANLMEREPIISAPLSQDDHSIALSTPSRLSVTSKPRYVSASRVRPSLGSTTTTIASSPLAYVDPKGSPGSVSSSNMETIGSFSSLAASSCFDPHYFMGLLKDGTQYAPLRLQNDRDMNKEFMKIKQNIVNEDWAPRFTALQQLQAIAIGNLAEFECGQQIKQLTDAVSNRFLIFLCLLLFLLYCRLLLKFLT